MELVQICVEKKISVKVKFIKLLPNHVIEFWRNWLNPDWMFWYLLQEEPLIIIAYTC